MMFRASSARTKVLFCAALVSLSAVASADPDTSMGMYIQGGRSTQKDVQTNDLALGLVVPLMPQSFKGSGFSVNADFSLSHFATGKGSGFYDAGREHTQFAALADLRYRFGSTSPFFVEAGLGGAATDVMYRTRFQFAEQIGAGVNFGAKDAQEVSLRLQNFSDDKQGLAVSGSTGSSYETRASRPYLSVRYLYGF